MQANLPRYCYVHTSSCCFAAALLAAVLSAVAVHAAEVKQKSLSQVTPEADRTAIDLAASDLVMDRPAPLDGLDDSVPPGPSVANCETTCDSRADHVLQTCLADGGEPAECQERAQRARERCLFECHQRACQHRCDLAARAVRQECLDAGEPEDVCNERAHRFIRHCLAGCEPLDCGERCHLVAQRLLADCISNGFPPAQCQAQAEQFLHRCLNVPPASCAERCQVRARIFHEHCVNDPDPAHPDVDCDHAAAVFLGDCLRGCQPPSCEEHCAAVGHAVARECHLNGGTPEECQTAAQQAVAACLANCDDGDGGGDWE